MQRALMTSRKVSSLTTDELITAKVSGDEPSDTDEGGNHLVGRDPRKMTQDKLIAMGHEPCPRCRQFALIVWTAPVPPVIEVRKCVATMCPSWPFRTGKNPWRAPPTEAQREQGHRRAAELRRALRSV